MIMSRLQIRSAQFYKALVDHSADEDVRDFLQKFSPLHMAIQQGEVVAPYPRYTLGAYFTNPDLSPLAERYGFENANNPLFNAAAEFMSAIMGWEET